jgi:hypothetical protein
VIPEMVDYRTESQVSALRALQMGLVQIKAQLELLKEEKPERTNLKKVVISKIQ